LRASVTITYAFAPCFSMLYFNFSALILFNSQAVILALLLTIAAICVVFPPGAAAISKISVFSCGFKIRGGNIDDKLCKYISPFWYMSNFCISDSFAFSIINASLYQFTFLNLILFLSKISITLVDDVFNVFTLKVVLRLAM